MTIEYLLITANIGIMIGLSMMFRRAGGVQLRICDSGDKEDFHCINKNTLFFFLFKNKSCI